MIHAAGMLSNIQEKLLIRKATREDVPVIVQLLAHDPLGKTREVATDPLPDAYYSAFQAIDDDPNQYLAVMEHEGRVIGTLQLSFIPGLSLVGSWRAQVEAVRIDEAFRGHGLGEYFMQWCVIQAKQRQCSLLQLTTDKTRKDAHRFYERFGFVASHEGMKLRL